MASREIMRKWQGRLETSDRGIMLERLRAVFSNSDLGLQSDFMEGNII